MEEKLENYIKEMEQAKTKEEIKEIITKTFDDDDINDKDFDDLINTFIPIIENNLGIHIDNYEETETSNYQKVLELNF